LFQAFLALFVLDFCGLDNFLAALAYLNSSSKHLPLLAAFLGIPTPSDHSSGRGLPCIRSIAPLVTNNNTTERGRIAITEITRPPVLLRIFVQSKTSFEVDFQSQAAPKAGSV